MTEVIRKTLKSKKFKLSAKAVEKLNAVEGIVLTSEMREDFERFERECLSPEERRKVLGRKYGKTS